MYPVARLIWTLARATRAAALKPDDISVTHFYCRPWDVDMFFEMNNGRILTLYDLGRFDLTIRSGLGAVMRKRRWGLVVAGSSVRYRQRISMFERVTMNTQVLGHDEKWIYIGQSMWVQGNPASSVLLRTAVTRKGGLATPADVMTALNISDWKDGLADWVDAWKTADAKRPWPPKP